MRYALALLGLSGIGFAADEIPQPSTTVELVKQVRISVGVLPGIGEGTVETESNGTTTHNDFSVDADGGGCIEGGVAVYQFATDHIIGFGGYVGLFMRNQSGTDASGTALAVSSTGIDVGADLALRPTPGFIFTVGPRIGLGVAHQDVNVAGFEPIATMRSFALQGGIYATVYRNEGKDIFIGAEGGWMTWESHGEYIYANGGPTTTRNETLRGNGAYGNLIMGVRF